MRGIAHFGKPVFSQLVVLPVAAEVAVGNESEGEGFLSKDKAVFLVPILRRIHLTTLLIHGSAQNDIRYFLRHGGIVNHSGKGSREPMDSV